MNTLKRLICLISLLSLWFPTLLLCSLYSLQSILNSLPFLSLFQSYLGTFLFFIDKLRQKTSLVKCCLSLLNRAWPWRMSDLVFIFLNFPLEYFFLFWCLIDPRGSLANPMHSRVYWLSITNSKFDVSRHFWFRKYALRKLENFFFQKFM